MTFESLGLSAELLRAVSEQGYTEPTPIQRKAIPLVLQGLDIMAGAQTGTGKTAAFGLPLIQRIQFRRWDEVSMILLVIVASVIVVDALSSAIRRRLAELYGPEVADAIIAELPAVMALQRATSP